MPRPLFRTGTLMSFVSVLCLACSATFAQEAVPAAKEQRAPKPIYDESADAKVQIAAAVAKAKKENTRVLVMFGGNWCGWCHKLHGLFKSDREIAKLMYEYEIVMIDIGRWDKHMDVAKGFGADLKTNGVPFLTFLDSEGKVLANQNTGDLEAGKDHDPEKVKALLTKYAPEPINADDVLNGALKRAKRENKMLFLHFGALWCGPCRRLENFMARKEIASVLARDFIDVKIDVDRMTNAGAMTDRFRETLRRGIPWFAIVDADGKKLATSEGPKGNIGFPVEPFEIAHFIEMLKKTAKNITGEQIDQIEKALQESARRIKGGGQG